MSIFTKVAVIVPLTCLLPQAALGQTTPPPPYRPVPITSEGDGIVCRRGEDYGRLARNEGPIPESMRCLQGASVAASGGIAIGPDSRSWETDAVAIGRTHWRSVFAP
jgi:hypothetical protein